MQPNLNSQRRLSNFHSPTDSHHQPRLSLENKTVSNYSVYKLKNIDDKRMQDQTVLDSLDQQNLNLLESLNKYRESIVSAQKTSLKSSQILHHNSESAEADIEDDSFEVGGV